MAQRVPTGRHAAAVSTTQPSGQQTDLRAEVARRKAEREAAAAERTRQLREKRLEAAAKAASSSEAASGWDPSGRPAAPGRAAASHGVSPARSRAGSEQPSARQGAAAARAAAKPAASTQSTDGSGPGRAERLSIGSAPPVRAGAVPSAAAPPAQGKWCQSAAQQVQLTEHEVALTARAAGAGAQAPEPPAAAAAAGAVPHPQCSGKAGPMSSSTSRAALQPIPQQQRQPQPSRGGAGSKPTPEQALGRAQRVPLAGPAAPAATSGAAPKPDRGTASSGVGGLRTQPSTAAAAAAAPVPPAEPPLSAEEAALAEERYGLLAAGHCEALLLRWLNCSLGAMLAGPAYEGQPVSAGQLLGGGACTLPAAATPAERVQQVEEAVALSLHSIEAALAEAAAARAAATAAAAGEAGAGGGDEKQEELGEALKLVGALEASALQARSLLAHWLQLARAEAAAVGGGVGQRELW